MSGAIQWAMVKSRTRASSLAVVAAWLLTAVAVADDGVEQVDSDTDRVPRQTVIPEYPEVARRDRVEGEVQVCFDISRDGHPQRIAVRRSTNRLFEKPARKAVRKSTWVPLERDEESSGIKACRTFRFSLVPVEEGPVQS
jgi:TonB family protein